MPDLTYGSQSSWLPRATRLIRESRISGEISAVAAVVAERMLYRATNGGLAIEKASVNSERGVHLYFAKDDRLCWFAIYEDGEVVACRMSGDDKPDAHVVGGGDASAEAVINGFRTYLFAT